MVSCANVRCLFDGDSSYLVRKFVAGFYVFRDTNTDVVMNIIRILCGNLRGVLVRKFIIDPFCVVIGKAIRGLAPSRGKYYGYVTT